ncbi:hypothetical protein [Gordonia phthalatica]|uniref:DUF4232 domain-containing protein n=1 Tax=Gordonia phthalatica TaxID=1136941 RepID=A0A0N9NIJ2_9ACTN|nr:hypothetical protein [Gordonia phthalatica]ALG85707.1 hypothetical protein ACH46_15990 [Gordonia phthalatica]
MEISVLSSTAARGISTALLVGAAGAALTGLAAGESAAAVGDNLPGSCQKFSQDSGATWGDATVITWNTADRPVPGSEIRQAAFQVKNICDTPAKFQVYAGDWAVSNGGAATVRANAGTARGVVKQLAGTPGILLVETGRLSKDKPISVEFFIGIPASTTQQGFTITPDWGTALEEVSADAPVDPGGNGGTGGSGSLDGVTGSSSGSLGDLVGGLFGSGSAASAGTTLKAPTVVAAR